MLPPLGLDSVLSNDYITRCNALCGAVIKTARTRRANTAASGCRCPQCLSHKTLHPFYITRRRLLTRGGACSCRLIRCSRHLAPPLRCLRENGRSGTLAAAAATACAFVLSTFCPTTSMSSTLSNLCRQTPLSATLPCGITVYHAALKVFSLCNSIFRKLQTCNIHRRGCP